MSNLGSEYRSEVADPCYNLKRQYEIFELRLRLFSFSTDVIKILHRPVIDRHSG